MRNVQEGPVGSGSVFNTSDSLRRVSLSSSRNPDTPRSFSFSRSIMVDPDVEEYMRHLTFTDATSSFGQPHSDAETQEIKTTPLFTSKVRSALKKREVGPLRLAEPADPYSQYGLLGIRQGTYGQDNYTPATSKEDNLVYANMNAPWSAFICGSQGGGKSHTLCCLLENALLSPLPTGVLPNPLAGLVFHYDKFTSTTTTQLCEAAYLCSSGIPVRVLVSPSNYHSMVQLYSNLPGLAPDAQQPTVMPLYLQEEQLNISNMRTLMAVTDGSNSTPLYLEVLFQILRDMAIEGQGRQGVDYREFRDRLNSAAFSCAQTGPLKLRLQLLESFLDLRAKRTVGTNAASSSDIWNFEPGSLTVVDLSDPFVNENDACALFSICLTLFMESRGQVGRIVALDEAHKFLTQSGEALNFTDDLISIIRQQRHLATRVLIATQEPTLSPALIDLCNVTIVHRFLSPAWFETLKKHLAGARIASGKDSGRVGDIFRTILGLESGEALVFSPTALLDVIQDLGDQPTRPHLEKLKDSYIKVRIRTRITADGGKSIMASDVMRFPVLRAESKSQFGSGDSNIVSSAVSGSRLEVMPLQASRFARFNPPTSQHRPQSKPETLQPAPQKQHQKPQSTKPCAQQVSAQQVSKKQQKATHPANGQAQAQHPQAPQKLPTNQKKASQHVNPSNQPQSQSGPQGLTKKQKKSLKQTSSVPNRDGASSKESGK